MLAEKDLTQGSVVRHILTMSLPMLALLLVQAVNYTVDLYFVAQLGGTAVAGVGIGSNAFFLSSSLIQVLGVGTITLISQAVGRRDPVDANLIFNQALSLSALFGLCVFGAGYLLAKSYVQSVAADEGTIVAGTNYLYWLLPGLVLQFALPVVTWALRALGIVQPPMIIYGVGIVVNAILAPILIVGWGTGYSMGVAGAGLANSLANLVSAILLWLYFYRNKLYVSVKHHQLKPRLRQWRRILSIGLPAGGEMILMFAYAVVIYWVIRNFGAVAQAGFSAGARIMQILLFPALSIALAVAPIVGQNFGAGEGVRVKEIFRQAAVLNTAVMLLIASVLQLHADLLLTLFTADPKVVEAGATFLKLASIGFVSRGIIYACSGLFQGLGNTVPSLASSLVSLAAFAIPAIYLSARPGVQIEHIWYLWTATVTLQAAVNLLLLKREFRRRLGGFGTLKLYKSRISPKFRIPG